MNSDNLFRFLFQQRNVRGEIVQLSSSLDQMLLHHSYPQPVKQLLAELVAATSLLTATLKFEGDIAVQVQGDGPVRFAAVNGTDQQQFRGVVRMQAEITGSSFRDLIGEGYLLVTITPKQGERYQGIIPLSGDSLTTTLEAYFAQSEQLPTRLYLYTDLQPEHCRAAGFMLQVLPVEQQKAKADFDDLVMLSDTLTQTEFLTCQLSSCCTGCSTRNRLSFSRRSKSVLFAAVPVKNAVLLLSVSAVMSSTSILLKANWILAANIAIKPTILAAKI